MIYPYPSCSTNRTVTNSLIRYRFGPGIPLYLTFFYPRARVGFRHGVFLAGAAMANVYGGALAYGISHIRGSLASWRVLFLLEGLPTVILAFVTWWWLPDNIQSTRFLTKREKQIASIFVARNQQADPSGKNGFQWREALLALKEPKSFIPPLFYFGVNVSFASLPLFVPTIISQMGSFTQIQSNGLSSPPYFLTFITMLLICWLSDRLLLKGPFIVLCTLVGAIGFILLATTTRAAPRYIGVFLAIQIFVGVPLILSWVATTHSTDSKRGGAQCLMYTIVSTSRVNTRGALIHETAPLGRGHRRATNSNLTLSHVY